MALLTPARRRRALQAGFAVAGLAAVAVADGLATAILHAETGMVGRQAHAFALLGGRVVAGVAFGLLFRVQLVKASAALERDRQLRWLVVLPAAVLAAWPVLLPAIPSVATGLLPAWVTTTAGQLAPVAALLLGLGMVLGVARPPRGS